MAARAAMSPRGRTAESRQRGVTVQSNTRRVSDRASVLESRLESPRLGAAEQHHIRHADGTRDQLYTLTLPSSPMSSSILLPGSERTSGAVGGRCG
jgi:hypothetical protein